MSHVKPSGRFPRFVRAAVVGSVGGTPVGGVGVIAKR